MAETYDEKRVRIRQQVKALGRGAQIRAAFDLRIHPGKVSNALNNRERRPDILAKLEEWLESDKAKASA